MSLFVLTKLFASVVTGMLGLPFGILPSVLLFRDLSNGLDDSQATKRNYALTLWTGMLAGWILASLLSWYIISRLFG
jgi:hypothetical protein